MQARRVVITGMSALTPIGNNLSAYWEGLSNGVSGAIPITKFNAENFKTRFACELKDFDQKDFLDRKEIRKMDLFTQYAMIVASQALEHSEIDINITDPNRIGVIWGAGIGGITTFEDEVINYVKNKGIPKFNPFFIPKMIADIAPGMISMKYGFRGPNFTTVSACASSGNSLLDALNYIRWGQADVIVSGGSEAAITQSGMGGFNALHALSTRNDDPATASRPFDKDREGFVMGEGAGCLILEDYQHAKKRGATIYAEFAGGGLSADAHHLTAPHPEGEGAKLAMQNCLTDARVDKTAVDGINVHGTSTPLGDVAEIKAVCSLFGQHRSKININATKSMTGHLLGAAGVIEAISCILSIENKLVPPTINHFETDEAIAQFGLNLTLNQPQERAMNFVISNTFGFGGHNVCLGFKKFEA